MLILGLSGRKQSGKNTAARHIAEYFGKGYLFRVREYSYADALKQQCMDLFGLSEAQCYGTDEQKNSATRLRWLDFWFVLSEEMKRTHDPLSYMSGREVMQVWGTDVVRRIYSDAWVRATISQIRRESYEVDIALITDVRFPNEVKGIQKVGGRVIRLTRAPFTEDAHASETALDDYNGFDHVLNNSDMTIEEQREPVLAKVMEWL